MVSSVFLDNHIPKGTKLYVVGDLHEQVNHFNKLIERVKPSKERILVSVGDVYDKGNGIQYAEEITRTLIELANKESAYVVRGNHELKHINNYKKFKQEMSPELKWWSEQPLVQFFVFGNGARVTVVHGGIGPHFDWNDLTNNVKVAYVREVDTDGEPIQLKWVRVKGKRDELVQEKEGIYWAKKYDGRFGYIPHGHHSDPNAPIFHNYSCNLDSRCYETGRLTCQEFNDDGSRGELISITK